MTIDAPPSSGEPARLNGIIMSCASDLLAPGIPKAIVCPPTSIVAPPFFSAVNRVAIRPKAMQLHRMLNIPHSRATVFVIPRTALFAAL